MYVLESCYYTKNDVHLRLLELPRRTSNRVLQKIKQKEEETKPSAQDVKEDEERNEDTPELARDNRAKRRNLLRYVM